jgi:hypothetical protein
MAAEGGVPIVVNDHTVRAASQLPGGHLHSEDASDSNYILIQTRSQPNREIVADLEALHVKVGDACVDQGLC